MKITDMTIKELKEQYKELEDIVDNIQCYGVNDLRLLDAIGKELYDRGYEPSTDSTTKWKKMK